MVPQLVPHDANNTVDATGVAYYYYNNSNNTSPFYELNENHSELCSNYYYVDIYSVKQQNLKDDSPTVWTQIQNNLLLFLQGKVKLIKPSIFFHSLIFFCLSTEQLLSSQEDESKKQMLTQKIWLSSTKYLFLTFILLATQYSGNKIGHDRNYNISMYLKNFGFNI